MRQSIATGEAGRKDFHLKPGGGGADVSREAESPGLGSHFRVTPKSPSPHQPLCEATIVRTPFRRGPEASPGALRPTQGGIRERTSQSPSRLQATCIYGAVATTLFPERTYHRGSLTTETPSCATATGQPKAEAGARLAQRRGFAHVDYRGAQEHCTPEAV